MRYLHIDTETLPALAHDAKRAIFDAKLAAFDPADIKPDGRLKDSDKIAADIAAKTDAAKAKLAVDADKIWRATGLDGWRGHVAVVGWAVDDLPVQSAITIDVFSSRVVGIDEGGVEIRQALLDTDSERENLLRALHRIEMHLRIGGLTNQAVVVCGHNVRRYDVLYLWQRCVALRIVQPEWLVRARFANRWSDEFVNDTMEQAGTTTGKLFGPSLDTLCRALGLPGKCDLDGSKVYDEVIAGRIDRVAAYCRDDVRRARSCWRVLRGRDPLQHDLELECGDIADRSPAVENYLDDVEPAEAM